MTKRVTQMLQMLPKDITPVNLEELRRVKQNLVELESKADTLRQASWLLAPFVTLVYNAMKQSLFLMSLLKASESCTGTWTLDEGWDTTRWLSEPILRYFRFAFHDHAMHEICLWVNIFGRAILHARHQRRIPSANAVVQLGQIHKVHMLSLGKAQHYQSHEGFV